MKTENIDLPTLIFSILAFAFGVWSLVHMIKRDIHFLWWLLSILIIVISIILVKGSLEKEDEDGE